MGRKKGGANVGISMQLKKFIYEYNKIATSCGDTMFKRDELGELLGMSGHMVRYFYRKADKRNLIEKKIVLVKPRRSYKKKDERDAKIITHSNLFDDVVKSIDTAIAKEKTNNSIRSMEVMQEQRAKELKGIVMLLLVKNINNIQLLELARDINEIANEMDEGIF